MATDGPGRADGPKNAASNPTRTTAVLDDLLNNPLDAGYRQAASSARQRQRWETPAAWLGCLLIGFVLVVAYRQNHRAAPFIATARKELIVRIHAAQADGDRTDLATAKLAAAVAVLRDSQLKSAKGGSEQSAAAAEIAAGTVPVSGQGVRIMLAEPVPSSANPGGVQSQPAVLTDTDIRAVVNELWAAGAEAVAVNGTRLSATSSIRVAGSTILVNFLPVNSPYTVEAIGPASTLLIDFADSSQARALQTKKAVESISFSFSTVSKLTLSAAPLTSLRSAAVGSLP